MTHYAAVIRKVPNSPRARKAVEQLRGNGLHTQLRGRGHRYGKGASYWTRLPLELASWVSVYQVEPTSAREPHQYQYADYVGITKSGKVRIRIQP